MGIATKQRRASTLWDWTARAVACFFLILGSLVFVTFLETGALWTLGITIAAVGGALLFIFGLERPAHPVARWARPVGWSSMAVASLLPSSLLFIPLVLALLALPAVLRRFRIS